VQENIENANMLFVVDNKHHFTASLANHTFLKIKTGNLVFNPWQQAKTDLLTHMNLLMLMCPPNCKSAQIKMLGKINEIDTEVLG
jgi:hypothetical protein